MTEKAVSGSKSQFYCAPIVEMWPKCSITSFERGSGDTWVLNDCGSHLRYPAVTNYVVKH